MFTALLLTPDVEAAKGLQRLAFESGLVLIQHTLAQFSQPYELTKAINSNDPDLVFLDISDWERAVKAGKQIRSILPSTVIIGFGGGWASQQESGYQEAGICTMLVSPVDLAKFKEGVSNAIHTVRGTVLDNLLAFLPAKAGSGCSVTALNVAGCFAGALRKKALLFENDLNSGVLSVLAKCSAEIGMQEVLANPENLNHAEWERFVNSRHGIDLVLRSSSAGSTLPDWSNYHHFLGYVAKEYEVVLADLPELVNEATQEIAQRAKTVFIVCTPEMTALALARQRLEELLSRNIDPERISIILNRWHETDQSPEAIQGLLKHPLAAVLPNDYNSLREAAAQGGMALETTSLGAAYLSLAKKLAGIPEDSPSPPPKAKFSLAAMLGR